MITTKALLDDIKGFSDGDTVTWMPESGKQGYKMQVGELRRLCAKTALEWEIDRYKVDEWTNRVVGFVGMDGREIFLYKKLNA